jgi:uncharacterized protein
VTTALPEFRYHPEPLLTGSVAQADVVCASCERRRGFVYTGPVYAVEEVEELCPWCIADGTAASRFGAEFTDVGWGVPSDVPRAVMDEVRHRTPGFAGWQQEHWLYHCGDAAAFLGRAGHREVSAWPDALRALRAEAEGLGWNPVEAQQHVGSLQLDGPPTAYLFRCLHCGTHLAYSDFT